MTVHGPDGLITVKVGSAFRSRSVSVTLCSFLNLLCIAQLVPHDFCDLFDTYLRMNIRYFSVPSIHFNSTES
jgi:hypothetical protein